MPTLDQVSAGASAITQINANEQSMQVAAAYGRRASTSSGLIFGYYGAILQDGSTVANGTITVGASTTTYVVVNRSTGAVSSATNTTNWNNTTDYMRMASLVSNASGITTYTDSRPVGGLGGGGGGGSGTVTSVDVAIDASAADLFSESGTPITTSGTATIAAVDAGSDKVMGWDDSANKATYFAPTYGLKTNGTDLRGALQCLAVACSDLTTNLTTGTGKAYFYAPYDFTVIEVQASLDTVQSAGSIFTVDINEGGVSILSTKLTIDNSEGSSITAATPPVISDSSLTKGNKITVDIDQVGTPAAKGLIVYIIGYPT